MVFHLTYTMMHGSTKLKFRTIFPVLLVHISLQILSSLCPCQQLLGWTQTTSRQMKNKTHLFFILVSTNFKSGLPLPKIKNSTLPPESRAEERSWKFSTAQSSTGLVRYQVCKFSKGERRTLCVWSFRIWLPLTTVHFKRKWSTLDKASRRQRFWSVAPNLRI